MDPFFLMVFAFVLLLVLFTGGFILIFPLTRRLGSYLEMQLERRRDNFQEQESLQGLEREVHELTAEVRRLAERQAFTDTLLSDEAEARRLGGTRDAAVSENRSA